MKPKLQRKLILLTGLAGCFAFDCANLSAQDLNPAIHYRTESPGDARFELLQSPLVARLTLLVDKNSGDVFQIVRTKTDEFAWEKIDRIKSKDENLDETQVNFQVFASGIAAKYTYLLNIRTGQTWTLTEAKSKSLFWDPIPSALATTPNNQWPGRKGP